MERESLFDRADSRLPTTDRDQDFAEIEKSVTAEKREIPSLLRERDRFERQALGLLGLPHSGKHLRSRRPPLDLRSKVVARRRLLADLAESKRVCVAFLAVQDLGEHRCKVREDAGFPDLLERFEPASELSLRSGRVSRKDLDESIRLRSHPCRDLEPEVLQDRSILPSHASCLVEVAFHGPEPGECTICGRSNAPLLE